MAANGRGQMRPNSGGRTPPFVIIGLLVVIGILAFNYWNLTSKNSVLGTEVEELGIKYRSSMKKYDEVDKLYRQSSESNIEFKQQNEECRSQINKHSEVHGKEKDDLIARLGSLAQEQESTKNDLNACDDEVGFCHENITRQVISHRKQLDDVQSRCRLDIDEAKSAAERRAADIETACETSVDARRLSILRGVQQVFGTKAVILLQEHTKMDISGIDLTVQDSNTMASQQKMVAVPSPQAPGQAQVYPQNPVIGQQVVTAQQVNQENIQPPQSQEQVQPPQSLEQVQPAQSLEQVQPAQSLEQVEPAQSQEQVQLPQEQVQLLQAPQQDPNASDLKEIDEQNAVEKVEDGIDSNAYQKEQVYPALGNEAKVVNVGPPAYPYNQLTAGVNQNDQGTLNNLRPQGPPQQDLYKQNAPGEDSSYNNANQQPVQPSYRQEDRQDPYQRDNTGYQPGTFQRVPDSRFGPPAAGQEDVQALAHQGPYEQIESKLSSVQKDDPEQEEIDDEPQTDQGYSEDKRSNEQPYQQAAAPSYAQQDAMQPFHQETGAQQAPYGQVAQQALDSQPIAGQPFIGNDGPKPDPYQQQIAGPPSYNQDSVNQAMYGRGVQSNPGLPTDVRAPAGQAIVKDGNAPLYGIKGLGQKQDEDDYINRRQADYEELDDEAGYLREDRLEIQPPGQQLMGEAPVGHIESNKYRY